MKTRLKKENVYSLIYSFLVFVLSLYIYPLYVNGDQEHYRLFYENAHKLNFFEAYARYFSDLGSLEPTYFVIVYYSSPYIDKDLLFSVLNGVLFYFFSTLLAKNKVNQAIIASFIFNFYFFVLFFAAERLKIGALFFIILCQARNNTKPYFALFTVISHLQMTIAIMLYTAKEISGELLKLFKYRLNVKILYVLSFAVILVVSLIPFLDQILNKFTFYFENSNGLSEMIKPAFIFIITLFYCRKNTFELVLMTVPLFVAVFFVGSDRLVMFSYFLFLYYALRCNFGINFGVLILNAYFIFKTYIFMMSMISCGEGFTCV